MKIDWKGNAHTNSNDRKGQVPQIIVDHISAGSMSSMDSWFTSPDNKVSSAHFGVSKRGEIHQYVLIERAAWTQGIALDKISSAPSLYVRSKQINPNMYAISIEHEGMDGELTEEQFTASVRLHHYIQNYVNDKWKIDLPLTRERVIGHYQIDPIRKQNCPGPKFPWAKLYEALSRLPEEEVEMEELKKRLEELQLAVSKLDERLNRLEQLYRMPEVPKWAEASVQKAVRKGLINTPEQGSYDFYRLLTILDRNEVL